MLHDIVEFSIRNVESWERGPSDNTTYHALYLDTRELCVHTNVNFNLGSLHADCNNLSISIKYSNSWGIKLI